MTHQEVENEAGEVVDVWDELPDAADPDLAPTVPTDVELEAMSVRGGLV